ncbi:MAG TPA: hypothetical protein VFQ35_20130 [Polyangiaceae bacterium]|nr:hypothetical protein [Polyangiaceae bacterium]
MLSLLRAPEANAAHWPVRAALRRQLALPLLGALLALACSEEVPLGSWGKGGGGSGAGGGSGGITSGGSTSEAGSSGEGNGACTRTGTPGPVNMSGSEVGATLTSSDWSWSARADAMEIDLTVEDEPPPGDDGYFWAYQFGLAGSPGMAGGFIGLQVNGKFTNTETNVTDYSTRLAVFWIAGPPLDGKFEDIVEPRAVRYSTPAFGTQWLAMNVIYPWEKCRTYRLRVGRHSVENGDIWYGAWITDTTTQVTTFIGRILVPGSWGQLARTSTSWCDRIGWGSVNSCSALSHVSASWRSPTATVMATNTTFMPSASAKNSFGSSTSPLRCASSRFTDLPDGVRQESGVSP